MVIFLKPSYSLRLIAISFFSIVLASVTSCSNSDNLDLQGYVDADYIYLGSANSGNLMNIFVIRGDRVKAKQKLFELDPEPQISQLQSAEQTLRQAQATLANTVKGQRQTVLAGIEAQISQAKANLALAEIRVAREQKLFQAKAASRDELDQAITTYKAQKEALAQLEANLAESKLGQREYVILAQQFAVDAALAQLRQALWGLNQKTQSAPTDAFVYDTYYRVGEFVGVGNPVVSLLAPQNIYVLFFISEGALSRIAIGQNVTIGCDGCKDTYTAKIRYISPQAEYTSPLIFSRENSSKLVFRVKAYPQLKQAYFFHPGQPVYVTVK